MTAAGAQVSVDERLAEITGQLAEIAGELRRQRQERERWQELADDLAPVATQAMAMATSHLEADEYDLAAVGRLTQALARDAALLEALLGQLRAASELAAEIGTFTAPAADSLTARLRQLDERGYFAFARQGAGIFDTIVTSFTEEEVRQLGDNIVLILRTVKQMTQPEIMGMLRRTAVTIAEAEAEDQAKAPSTLALLRQLRDPQARRGLARAITTLRALGAEPEIAAIPAAPGER